MITSGSLAIAMAIITRWRMPPENSWGNDLRRIFGLGMPTRSSSSTARARAAEPDMLLWTSNASVIWSPTVKIGVSDDSGSWNTIASSLPRSFDIVVALADELVAVQLDRPGERRRLAGAGP